MRKKRQTSADCARVEYYQRTVSKKWRQKFDWAMARTALQKLCQKLVLPNVTKSAGCYQINPFDQCLGWPYDDTGDLQDLPYTLRTLLRARILGADFYGSTYDLT